MADAADDANDLAQQHIDQLLSNRQRGPRLRLCGECHNPLCGNELDNERALFCGAECSMEWEKRNG